MGASNVIMMKEGYVPTGYPQAIQTIIWERRYSEPGMFEVHCSDSDAAALLKARYVYKPDRKELGVVRETGFERSESGRRTVYAKGYFYEAQLEGRVIQSPMTFKGTPEEIARDILTKCYIGAEGYDGRAVTNIKLGNMSDVPQEETEAQFHGQTVSAAIYAVESAHDLTHKIEFEAKQKEFSFSVYKGRDRKILFSDMFANITNASYRTDKPGAPNVAYVGYNKDDEIETILIDAREADNEGKKDPAIEIYIDATSVRKEWKDEDGKSHKYTDEEYLAAVKSFGLAKLAENAAIENITLEVDPNTTAVYMHDYDIGDTCTVQLHPYGAEPIEITRRLMTAREVYEGGRYTLSLSFGDQEPRTLVACIKKSADVNRQASSGGSTIPSKGSSGGGGDGEGGDMLPMTAQIGFATMTKLPSYGYNRSIYTVGSMSDLKGNRIGVTILTVANNSASVSSSTYYPISKSLEVVGGTDFFGFFHDGGGPFDIKKKGSPAVTYKAPRVLRGIQIHVKMTAKQKDTTGALTVTLYGTATCNAIYVGSFDNNGEQYAAYVPYPEISKISHSYEAYQVPPVTSGSDAPFSGMMQYSDEVTQGEKSVAVGIMLNGGNMSFISSRAPESGSGDTTDTRAAMIFKAYQGTGPYGNSKSSYANAQVARLAFVGWGSVSMVGDAFKGLVEKLSQWAN